MLNCHFSQFFCYLGRFFSSYVARTTRQFLMSEDNLLPLIFYFIFIFFSFFRSFSFSSSLLLVSENLINTCPLFHYFCLFHCLWTRIDSVFFFIVWNITNQPWIWCHSLLAFSAKSPRHVFTNEKCAAAKIRMFSIEWHIYIFWMTNFTNENSGNDRSKKKSSGKVSQIFFLLLLFSFPFSFCHILIHL